MTTCLPTRSRSSAGAPTYIVQTRAYLPKEAAVEIGQLISTQPDGLPELIRKLLRLDPALLAEAAPARFPSVEVAVEFWRRTWAALRLEERYVPLTGLDLYQIAPTVSGEMLRPLLESGATIRMHVNNGAVASFVDTVPLLHPYGRLIYKAYSKSADLVRALAQVLNAEARALAEAGAELLQINEPFPSDKLIVNPDCGLRHLPADVARSKLAAMVEGTATVRRILPVQAGPAESPITSSEPTVEQGA